MFYEKIRRKQARKDLILGGVLVLLLALLFISVITLWVIGFKTPQNATFRDWFVLVSAVIMLGVIVFIVLLLANAFLRDRDFRKRLIETFKSKLFGVVVVVVKTRFWNGRLFGVSSGTVE